MPFTVTTWNINSVRLRAGLVGRFLSERRPDVLCLQETKCPVEALPLATFAELGYGHAVARGEKAYNGVLILSRLPLRDAGSIDFCEKGDTRHVAAAVTPEGGPEIVIHNLYVPAGGDEPDPEANPKFAHKLAFVDEMATRFAAAGRTQPSLLVGDLNIAPLEHDVWSHKQLLKVVSHTPVEVAAFERAQAAGGWIDGVRHFTPPEEKLYSWWSYRARDWSAADKGRRLDHVWASPELGSALASAETLREARGWEKPSDHAPVSVTFAL